MAGEAHPVPFRTRKLSPRAPMVLRRKAVGEQGAADQQGAFSRGGGPVPAPAGAGPLCVCCGLFYCFLNNDELASVIKDVRPLCMRLLGLRPFPGCGLRLLVGQGKISYNVDERTLLMARIVSCMQLLGLALRTEGTR